MTATIAVKTAEMDRAEWLEWRRKGLGGSDCSAILGLNKYKPAFEIYAEKVGLSPAEEPDNLFPVDFNPANHHPYTSQLCRFNDKFCGSLTIP